MPADGTVPGPMVPVAHRVTGRRTERLDTATLALEPIEAGLAGARPGQFHMLWAFGVGEVPISVSHLQSDGPGTHHHTVRAVGATTRALCTLAGRRSACGALRPRLGPRRRPRRRRGGRGRRPRAGTAAPVVEEVIAHRDDFGRVALLIGARRPMTCCSPTSWPSGGALRPRRRGHRRPRPAGWHGDVGVVTSLVPRIAIDRPAVDLGVRLRTRGHDALRRAGPARRGRRASSASRSRSSATWCAPSRTAGTASSVPPSSAGTVRSTPSTSSARSSTSGRCDGLARTAPPGRVEVRVLRRLPAHAARLRGRAARRGGPVEIAHFLEARGPRSTGPYDLSLVEGSVTTPDDVERIRHGPGRVRPAGDHRGLRHVGRRAGAAQLRRRPRVPRSSTPARSTSRRSTSARPSPPTSRSTSSCRAVRSTSGQLLEVMSAYLAGRRPRSLPTASASSASCGGTCAWSSPTAHRAWAHHPRRLRCAVPDLPARLLRLLRPEESPTADLSCPAAAPWVTEVDTCASSGPSTHAGARSATRAGATATPFRSASSGGSGVTGLGPVAR